MGYSSFLGMSNPFCCTVPLIEILLSRAENEELAEKHISSVIMVNNNLNNKLSLMLR